MDTNNSQKYVFENSDLNFLRNVSNNVDLKDNIFKWGIYSFENDDLLTRNSTIFLESGPEINSSIHLADYISRFLGPKEDKFPLAVSMTVIYVMIFLSGVFGNICTMVVILKNFYMRTVTNYYLASLALSDLLALIFGKYTDFFRNILVLFHRILKISWNTVLFKMPNLSF